MRHVTLICTFLLRVWGWSTTLAWTALRCNCDSDNGKNISLLVAPPDPEWEEREGFMFWTTRMDPSLLRETLGRAIILVSLALELAARRVIVLSLFLQLTAGMQLRLSLLTRVPQFQLFTLNLTVDPVTSFYISYCKSWFRVCGTFVFTRTKLKLALILTRHRIPDF